MKCDNCLDLKLENELTHGNGYILAFCERHGAYLDLSLVRGFENDFVLEIKKCKKCLED